MNRLALIAVVGLAACHYDAPYLVLHVSGAAELPIVARLHVDLTLVQTGLRGALDDTRQPLWFPRTVGVTLPRGTDGDVAVAASARDAGGAVLATGNGRVHVSGNGVYDLAIALGGDGAGDGGTDGAIGCDTLVCDNGCVTTPTPHCRSVVPTAPVTTGDFHGALAATTIGDNATFNCDTGVINTGSDVSAVSFHVAAGEGIFSFGSLTITSAASVSLVGKNTCALVAAHDLTIAGSVVALAGGGGGAPAPGGGGDGNTDSSNASGAGGGGHGGIGGRGFGGQQSSPPLMPGAAGSLFDATLLAPVHGGGGGGHGILGGAGGLGGGGVQLVANHRLVVGGVVNAGGQGGRRGISGGGGGAGGGILLEAATVEINGSLAANGGGGGGGGANGPSDGQPGGLGSTQAAGGNAGNQGSAGGNGAAHGTNRGNGRDSNDAGGGGGGGGALGRIRINSASGAATLGVFASLSPDVTDVNGIGESLATEATLSIE